MRHRIKCTGGNGAWKAIAANLSVLSYDPRVYSKGRSPLEAVSMGINLRPDEVAIRCNLVTLSEEDDYTERTMIDHSADEITTDEARELIPR